MNYPEDFINKIIHGDCLEVMKDIPDQSIDMILADLPYNKYMGKWDKSLNINELWKEYIRIIRDKCAIVLFSQNPLTSYLIQSNVEMFKYEWIWDKGKQGNIFSAKLYPLIIHEHILIFSNGTIANGSKRNMKYFPQMEELDSPRKYHLSSSGKSFQRKSHKKVSYTKTSNYPKSIIYFYNGNLKNKYHPTQKPVALLEYLIKTYTNENDIVLDNVIGSGTTAVACINTNRRFIGIEKEKKYVDIARQRIGELV